MFLRQAEKRNRATASPRFSCIPRGRIQNCTRRDNGMNRIGEGARDRTTQLAGARYVLGRKGVSVGHGLAGLRGEGEKRLEGASTLKAHATCTANIAELLPAWLCENNSRMRPAEALDLGNLREGLATAVMRCMRRCRVGGEGRGKRPLS